MTTGATPIKPTSTPSSPLSVSILAIALYIALIDAAVETFLSGSPVRWWVAGIVTAYLALSIGLWRYRRSAWEHMSWATRATESFFLLLALLAFTAWLPDGLTDGIRLLGQPTSRVLSLLTAIVVALAGVSLARRSWPKPWVKWVIGALTAYSVVALGKGMISGTSYPELFHGQSFWSWLPQWLQGAFIGALIIVPVEVIARARRMLKAAPGAARTWELRQLAAMAMSVALVISGVTNSAYGGPQPSAAEIVQPVAKSYQELSEGLAGPKPKTPPTPDQVAEKLEKLFPMLEKAEREIPRDTFDLQAVIDKVGKDPQKLFAWVRDNTYFVPYRGLLRGDKGVLMDRLGNSLDRAMLLYAMLRSIGQAGRLAHGTLTEAQAQNVLKKVRPFPSFGARTDSAPSATDAFIREYAEENHLDAARIRKALGQLTARQQRVTEMVQKRVAAQAAMIGAAVGPPPKSALAEEHTNQLRAVTDHWWVQWQNEANWTDLDPTLPDARPSQTLVSKQETLAADNLPSTLYHEVQIRIMVEQWNQGNLQELPVLEKTLRPSELLGQAAVLHHIPLKWPSDLNLFEKKDPLQLLKATVQAQEEWLPVLSIGESQVIQSSFMDSGAVIHSPGAPILGGSAEKLGAGLGNILAGGGVGQIPGHEAEKKAELTAEWIEYEVHSPGDLARRVRRQIFDLLGPAARSTGHSRSVKLSEAQRMDRGMALLGETDILPLSSALSPNFIAHLTETNLLGNRDSFLGAIHSLYETNLKKLAHQVGKFTTLPFPLYDLASALRGAALSSKGVYLDRPNIFSYHRRPRVSEQGWIYALQGFDIVVNDVAVRLGVDTNPFNIRLAQGVLDSNIEAVVLASDCYGKPCRPITSAAELVAQSRVHGIRWVPIRNVNERFWREAALPADMRARVEQNLIAGYAAVVPQSQIFFSGLVGPWWRVDPTTGQALAIGPDGRGEAQEETDFVYNLVLYTSKFVAESPWMAASFTVCKLCHGLGTCLALALAEGVLGLLFHHPSAFFAGSLIIEVTVVGWEANEPKPLLPSGAVPCHGWLGDTGKPSEWGPQYDGWATLVVSSAACYSNEF